MEDDKPQFRIGASDSHYLTVRPLYRPYDQCQDYWDGNWVNSQIIIRVGGFNGNITASLRTDEFMRFKEELSRLYSTLKGRASFSSMEHWLTIHVEGDGLGHFEAECVVMDEVGIGNRLQFRLDFDQTELPGIVKGLEGILQAFPVRGRANSSS
jgi:hypothetical protein